MHSGSHDAHRYYPQHLTTEAVNAAPHLERDVLRLLTHLLSPRHIPKHITPEVLVCSDGVLIEGDLNDTVARFHASENLDRARLFGFDVFICNVLRLSGFWASGLWARFVDLLIVFRLSSRTVGLL